jgi:PiT family inorganic phosphate transporter
MDAVALALPVLIALITVALAFDFLNGLHDAANSIATIVSTRVLRPQHAVIWAAFFNFIAFLIFGAHVAETVGTGIVAAEIVDPRVVFGALTGAIAWNIITWALGIPSSSSHALIGGLVGAGVAKAGIKVIVWGGLGKTTAAIVLSPLTGFFLALRGRSPVPFASTGFSFALFHRSRRQRRPENHGHHHGAALFPGLSGR